MAEKRKDSKGRVLRKGEHERTDGTYHYTWLDAIKKRRYIYAKTLQELREKEQELQKDILDGIDTTGGKITLNQLFKMHISYNSNRHLSALWRTYRAYMERYRYEKPYD